MSALYDETQHMFEMFFTDVKNLTLKKWIIVATVYIPTVVLAGINAWHRVAFMFAMFVNFFVMWATYDADAFDMFMSEPLYFYMPVLIVMNAFALLPLLPFNKSHDAADINDDAPKQKEE